MFKFLMLLSINICTLQVAYGSTDWRIQKNSRVVYSETRSVDSHLIALATYKKISGRWQADKERRYSGTLERKTIEVDRALGARNSFDFYRDQLLPKNTRELFFCAKRQCGSSNGWANQHFKVSQLYGDDRDQYYGVYAWQKSAESTIEYVTIYSVRRGNGRVYVQLDKLIPENDVKRLTNTPEAIVKQWKDYGVYPLSQLQVTDESVVLTTDMLVKIKKALVTMPVGVIAVVGHDYSASSQAARLELSKRYARDIADQLIRQGIAPKRLQVHGLGGLAPNYFQKELYRVELVLIQ